VILVEAKRFIALIAAGALAAVSLVYRHGYHLPYGAVGVACDGLWPAGLAAVDLSAGRADLTSVVSGTLEPSHVSLWLSDRGVTMGK
jgi:hypothetical protein